MNIAPKNLAIFSLLLFASAKILFFLQFNTTYADMDQCLIWQMIRDYSSGNFSQLFYYGQAYNFSYDAWLGIFPFKLGVPIEYSAPIAMLLLSSAPIIILWYQCYKTNQFGIAISILCFSILATYTGYYLQSTGISAGINLVFLICIFLRNTRHYIIFLVCTFIMFFIGFTINNAMPLAVWAVSLYIFNSKGKPRIILIFLALLCFVSCYIIFSILQQNQINNGNVIHVQSAAEFTFSNFLTSIIRLQKLFYGLGPIYEYFGFIIFLILLYSIYYFYVKRKFALSIANGLFCLTILIIFASKKGQDIQVNAYFSGGRLYLSMVPVFILSVLTQYNIAKKHLILVVSVTALYFVVFNVFFKEINNYHFNQHAASTPQKIENIRRKTFSAIKYIPEKNATIVSLDDPAVIYAIGAWFPQYHAIYLPYDRRPERYRKFYFETVTDFYLLNSRIPISKPIGKGYQMQIITNPTGYLYHISGTGLSGKEFMLQSEWEWWFKLNAEDDK